MERFVNDGRQKILKKPQGAEYNSATYLQLPLRAEVEFAVTRRLWKPLSFPSPQQKVEMPERIEGTILRDTRELLSDISQKGKEIVTSPVKRLKRRFIAGAVLGTLVFGGALAAPEQSQGSNEVKENTSVSSETIDVWKSERNPTDRFDLTKDRWMKVPIEAHKAPPPSAMKAEVKPKPKASQLSSGVKKIVFEVAQGCGVADQFDAIDYIVNHESTWNPEAVNRDSGAGGLFQALPPSKMDLGSDWKEDVRGQAEWGVCKYMNDRYGDPNGARAFRLANGWY